MILEQTYFLNENDYHFPLFGIFSLSSTRSHPVCRNLALKHLFLSYQYRCNCCPFTIHSSYLVLFTILSVLLFFDIFFFRFFLCFFVSFPFIRFSKNSWLFCCRYQALTRGVWGEKHHANRYYCVVIWETQRIFMLFS